MKQPIQSLSINTDRDGHLGPGSAGHSQFDAQSDYNLSPETPDENIDFNLVYALFAFEASVDGQANVIQGESLMLLDDSNSYWWLIRVLRDNSVGYLPAENIETPYERLARLNRHRNQKLFTTNLDQKDTASNQQKKGISLRPQNNKSVSFQTPFMPEILGDSDDDYHTEYEDDNSIEADSPRNNSVASNFNSSIYHLDQAQKSSSIDISVASTQDSHEIILQEAVQILTVHTGNIDLKASWKSIVTNSQTVTLDIIEESLEKFDLEECTSANYYIVVYDSEEQVVYRLDDYDSPTEVIECIHEGTFQVPASNKIQDSIYMYLSNHLTTSASLPNAAGDISFNKAHSLTFYLNRKLRTIRKDEDVTLRFPIQMITIQDSGQNLNRMCIIKAKPSTMVIDFLKLVLIEFEIDPDKAIELSSEYQVSLSTSDLERPLPFDSTLTTVFQVILNYDVVHEKEDVLFVVRKNYSPKVNPLSFTAENAISSASYEKVAIPVIEETYDSDSEEAESLLEDLGDEDGSKLNAHQMNIRLSIVGHDKDDISEVLDDVINDYNDQEEEDEMELPHLNNYSTGNNFDTTQFPNIHEETSSRSSRSINSPQDTINIAFEPTDLQIRNVTRSVRPENGLVVSLRMKSHNEKRPSSTEIKTRAIVSSVLRRIAPPPKSPPPPNLIAHRKSSVSHIPIDNTGHTLVQDDTDDQIIANLIINTQLIQTVCNSELAEDVPLADLHGHQITDKQVFFTSSESLIEGVDELAGDESIAEILPQEQRLKPTTNLVTLRDVDKPQSLIKGALTAEPTHMVQASNTKSSSITVKSISENGIRQSSGYSPIAYLEEYLGTMRSQSVRRKNKDDKKVVKLEELLGRAVPSSSIIGAIHELPSIDNDFSEEALPDSPRSAESLNATLIEATVPPKESIKSMAAPRPDSTSSEVDGSVRTDSSGLNSQACKLLPIYNIQQTNDSGVALYYNDDEINNLILLVRGAARFDYDHDEADGSLNHRKEFEQGDSVNQEVRKIFASTEEHLREIEQELDKVMAAIVNVF